MTEQFEHIFDPLKRETLTAQEREAIKRELRLFIVEHPIRAGYAGRFGAFTQSLSFRRTVFASMAFVLVLCVGVGTSYAAEGTLPGDLLYPVKVRVNEPVAGALAVTPEAKAKWSTEVATRRIEEAETLAASGRLTATTSAEVHQSLAQAADDFDAAVASLSASAVADAQSNFEATMTAHARVLGAIAQKIPQSREDLEPILATVQERERGAEAARASAERALARADDQELRAVVVAKKQAAATALRQVQTLVGASTGGATSTGASAGRSIEVGDETMNHGDLGGAYSAFQAAIRVAKEAKLNAEAQERLGERVSLPPFNAEDATSSGTHEGSGGSGKTGSTERSHNETVTPEQATGTNPTYKSYIGSQ